MKIETILPNPKDRFIYLNGDIEQGSVGHAVKVIIEINDIDQVIGKQVEMYGLTYTPKPIKIFIDSFGGDIYSCFGLVGVIETSKTPIYTYLTGAAMSAGFLILVSGHKRFCYPYSTLMCHQISTTFEGEARNAELDVKENQRIMEIFEDIVIKKTKISKRKLNQIYKEKEDWYISPAEGKKLMVIDEIITPEENTTEE